MTRIKPVARAVHRAKVQAHRGVRWVEDRRDPLRPARASRLLVGLPEVANHRSPLLNWEVDGREWPLELGKVENLRVAACSLDGLEFEADQVFSFWAQVGPPVRARGFVIGRELREGCVIPGVGGGLCLLSNALFATATRAGMRILERHPHSRRPPGSRAALGEDATVAWNYIDLRFVGEAAWRLEVELDAQELIVGIRTERRRRSVAVVRERRRGTDEGGMDEGASGRARGSRPWVGEDGPSCRSCEQPCELAEPAVGAGSAASGLGSRERRAWLLDGVWPEYAQYLRSHARPDDHLAIPIDGELVGAPRYAWPRVQVAGRAMFPLRTLARSLRSRTLARQGPLRQRALLDDERRLAQAMAASLSPAVTQLVVAQNLLPHLRRLGVLGGREVTVLMQRLPLLELAARLDEAHARHPASPTLADFRPTPELVDDETRALAAAVSLLTPHAEVADCFPGKATRLDWSLPTLAKLGGQPRAPGPLRLWLPSSTVGRKGVWELREALAELGPCTLWVAGGELEGPGFWPAPLRVEHGTPSLASVDAVVLPAWVEHQPRALLRAVAAGVPVIASRACGLGGGLGGGPSMQGVHVVATGDVEELAMALAAL
jgi:hypothetical protein